jgi:hypothetical protein
MKNQKVCIFLLLLIMVSGSQAQSIFSIKSGKISFFAGTPMEDIDAVNSSIKSFFNITTGEVVISMSNKDFIFKRALMQEHFNENYMESEKYPKSEFKGKVVGIENYSLSTTGSYKVQVEGTLTIHGVAKPRKIDVNIENKNGVLIVDSKFDILLTDHNIERPQIVWQKIAEIVQTTLSLSYESYKK